MERQQMTRQEAETILWQTFKLPKFYDEQWQAISLSLPFLMPFILFPWLLAELLGGQAGFLCQNIFAYLNGSLRSSRRTKGKRRVQGRRKQKAQPENKQN